MGVLTGMIPPLHDILKSKDKTSSHRQHKSSVLMYPRIITLSAQTEPNGTLRSQKEMNTEDFCCVGFMWMLEPKTFSEQMENMSGSNPKTVENVPAMV